MPAGQMDYYQQQLPGAQITGHSFELCGVCAACIAEDTSKILGDL